MAAAPRWKVYDAQEHYQAACKEIEAAASLMSFYSDGATIRDGHDARPVWTEGSEEIPAGESYDRVGEIVDERLDDRLASPRQVQR